MAAGYGEAVCGAYGNRNFYLYFEDWFGGIVDETSILSPENLKVSQDDNNIIVTWDRPGNIELFKDVFYEIVIADDLGNEIKTTASKDVCTFVFDNLPFGRYIAASVKAVSVNTSAHIRVTFDFSVGNSPSAPTNLKVGMKNGGIEVSWSEPIDDGGLDILEYEVVIADIDKKETKIVVDGDKMSFVFYGLPLNEYFAASVKAINAKGGQHERITFSIKNYTDMESCTVFYDGFIDMPQDEVSKTAVSWAVLNGITDENEYFNGDDPLTRRQAMVLLWRMSGKPAVVFYDGFIDMPQDEVSKTAVSWAVLNGITDITDENEYFNGDDPLTRRQAMVLLWRMYYNLVVG